MGRPLWAVITALTIRYYREHPLRFLLCLLGVAAGVAIASSIRLTNDRIIRSFSDSVDVLVGQSSLHVDFPAGIPVQRLEDFRFVWNYGSFSPCIRLNVRQGERPIRLMGVDFVSGTGGRRFRRVDEDIAQSARLWNPGEDTIVVPEGSLLIAGPRATPETFPGARTGGDVITVDAGSHPLRFTRVVRLHSVNGQSIPADLAYVDIGMLLGKGYRLTCMDVTAENDSDLPGLRDAILRAEPSAILETPGERKAGSRDMLAAFQMNLSALGMVALVVSAFLVYNTMSISILQRERLSALLHVQGATRGQLFAVFLFEGAAFGLLGGIPGIAAGLLMAGWADGEVSQTLRNVFRADAFASPDMRDVTAIVVSLLSAVVFSMLAALHPAWQGSRNVARLGLRGGHLLSARSLYTLSGIGVTSLAGFGLLGWLALHLESVTLGFAGVAALILTLSLLSPVAVLAFVGLYRSIPYPPEARLAAAELRMHAGRLSVAVAALAIALSMAGSITIMVHSFRTTVEAWLDAVIIADVYVSPQAGSLFPDQVLDQQAVRNIVELADVRDVISVRRLSVAVEGKEVDLFAEDLADLARLVPPSIVEGTLEDVRRAGHSNGVLVSEVFAQRFHHRRGDRLRIFDREYTISAVVRNFNSERGAIWMDPAQLDGIVGPLEPSALALFLNPGVDGERAIEHMRSLEGGKRVHFSLNRQIRNQAMVIFDRTFHMTRLLQAMAAGIATLAFVTTLLSLNLEQRRVLHTLMALGVPSLSCAMTLLLQSLFMGLVGLVLALPGSALLSWLLIHVINRFSFGWTIVLDIPWVVLAETGLLVLAFAALASIGPARLLLRESPAEVLKARE